MTSQSGQSDEGPISLQYRADLCGNIEQALKGLQGYGTMALELIQNADDAGAKNLTFDAREDSLLVINDAQFSSCGLTSTACPWEHAGDNHGLKRACNFHAISTMGGRNKIGAVEQIGRFGIGFVSVYQITDTPIVRSVGTELLLNPLNGTADQKSIDVVSGTEFELPWASGRSDIRNALNASPTPTDVVARFVEAVTKILQSSLLFLRNLERVEIRLRGDLQIAVDILRTENEITLTFGPKLRTEKWLILSHNAEDLIEERELMSRFEALPKLGRSSIVSVAIPADEIPIEGRLYAYLPTQHSNGMQLHVNADFFPHASRKEIVLEGEGHERHWNEALLNAAAEALGASFLFLRDTLGPSRLWQIGSDAFKLRDQGAFEGFWTNFCAAAKGHESVWSIANEWCSPETVYLAPEQMPGGEQDAIFGLGLNLLNPEIRGHWTALSAIGARELRLSTVVGQLEVLNGDGIADDNQQLDSLWAAIARLVDVSSGRSGYAGVIKQLSAAIFLVDVNGTPHSPDALWRTSGEVELALVHRFLPTCPIVHPGVLVHAGLAQLIDEYKLNDFAKNLSEIVKTDDEAKQIFGLNPDDIRTLYSLLVSFECDASNSRAGQILAETPFLKTPNGFIAPARGQLPGGFKDPTGHFEFIETSFFPPGMEGFAKDILHVGVLGFHEYINDHLEAVLASSPSKEQYRSLLSQIIARKNELDDRGSLQLLADRAFVRTRAGTFVCPNECYFWTAELEALLGRDGEKWVDNAWMPPGAQFAKLRDLLEDRLWMPTTVGAHHLVERVGEIAENGTPNDVAKAVTPIIRYILEHWPRFTEGDLKQLSALRGVEFLPAIVDGARDAENLYLPEEVFRAGRAPGFASQVPVIDIAPLRQTTVQVSALLDLLGVQEEPDTDVIVRHLELCMSSKIPPSDLTYALLNERVEKRDDLASVDRLEGTEFIYDVDLQRFLAPDKVFWSKPSFGSYWHAASNRMSQRDSLYSRLGVRQEPAVLNYASLMIEIAESSAITEVDILIHAQCLGVVCEALDNGDSEAEEAVQLLHDNASLLDVDGESKWPEDVVWIDSEQLSAPFASALNYRLVHAPNVTRNAAARLFQQLGVSPLSEVAFLRLATEPDRSIAPEPTLRLRERAALLLWLAPNPSSRRELGRLLDNLEIQLSGSLKIQAEINEFDPPVRSPVSDARAFHEVEQGVLHIKGSDVGLNEWVSAFRSLFAEIEKFCPLADMKPLPMTAATILLTASIEDAEEALLSSGFRSPESEDFNVPLGEQIGDADEELLYPDGVDEDVYENTEDPNDHLEVAEPGQADEAQNESTPVVVTGNSPDYRSKVEENEHEHINQEEDYKSRPGTGKFGGDTEVATTQVWPSPPRRNGRAPSGDGRSNTNPTTPHTNAERKTRTSRMLAYVTRSGDRQGDDREPGIHDSDATNLIDIAAIKAALKYEETRDWRAEEQAHGNPGYDIISTGPNGQRRLIEVKGLQSDWTERGIKLSSVQYEMAKEHLSEYWIYVVENAPDLDGQVVHAISNPFEKVQEYWFDDNWRDTAEEAISSRQLNVRVGAKVRHEHHGNGVIYEVERKGIATMIKADFGINGKRNLPFNSKLTLIY